MTIAETKISGRQFMYSIICFIQASAILNAFISNITYQESWLVVIFAFIIFIPSVFMYGALINRFKDKNLIQIVIQIFGPILGRIISVIYLIFCLSITMFNITDLTDITKTSMLPTTPYIILVMMCILITAWAVRSGLRVLTIYSKMYVFLASFIIILSIIFLFNVIEIGNLFPIFSLPLKKYVQGIHILNAIPFGELVVFLLIAPNVQMNKKQTYKYFFLGASIGAFSFFLTVLRDISVLGETFGMFVFPSLVAFRLIRITEAITRIEILFIVILIILLIFKISILYYVTVITVSQIFNLKKYKNIVLSVGFFLMTAAIVLSANSIQHTLAAQNGAPFIWVTLQIIFPFILLLISLIFNIKSPKEESK